ncbi:MAG: hypothetical protein WCA30_04415, partial [Dermatophilaceae bacterium]
MRVAIDWVALTPVLAPAIGALLVLLADAIAPRLRTAHLAVALVALGAGAATAGWAVAGGETVRSLCLEAPEGACLYAVAPTAGILQVAALAAAAVVLLM